MNSEEWERMMSRVEWLSYKLGRTTSLLRQMKCKTRDKWLAQRMQEVIDYLEEEE